MSQKMIFIVCRNAEKLLLIKCIFHSYQNIFQVYDLANFCWLCKEAVSPLCSYSINTEMNRRGWDHFLIFFNTKPKLNFYMVIFIISGAFILILPASVHLKLQPQAVDRLLTCTAPEPLHICAATAYLRLSTPFQVAIYTNL